MGGWGRREDKGGERQRERQREIPTEAFVTEGKKNAEFQKIACGEKKQLMKKTGD